MCGGERERPGQGYCRNCSKLYKRAYRIVHGREARRRDAARAGAHYLLRTGKLVREPCEVCGSEPAQMHHPDHNKVDEVRWLCTTHHGAEPKDRLLPELWRGRVRDLALYLHETGNTR